VNCAVSEEPLSEETSGPTATLQSIETYSMRDFDLAFRHETKYADLGWTSKPSRLQHSNVSTSVIKTRETYVRHHCEIALRMGGERTAVAPTCPSCGKPMGLSRTINASAGFRELRTFGCRDCGVWVTEGKNPWVGKRENLKRAPITGRRN
jgi:hypothetical protein